MNSRCVYACRTPSCIHAMVKATTESRPCPTCGEIFTKGKSMRKHREKTHETFKCTSCSCAFLDKTALAVHYGIAHLVGSLHPCLCCSDTFANQRLLRKHWGQAHKSELPGPRVASGSGTVSHTPATSTTLSSAPTPPSPSPVLPIPAASPDPRASTSENVIGDHDPGSFLNRDIPSNAGTVPALRGIAEVRTSSEVSSSMGPPPELCRDNGMVIDQSSVDATTSSADSPPAKVSPAALGCKICMGIPTDPIITTCGHMFCERCIMKELPKTLGCPVCFKVMFLRVR